MLRGKNKRKNILKKIRKMRTKPEKKNIKRQNLKKKYKKMINK